MDLQSEKWKEILSAVDADNDLNESNVFDKIKEKLKAADLSEYERWKEVDFNLRYSYLGFEHNTIFYLAAKNGYMKTAKALLDREVDVNCENIIGVTLLQHAVRSGSIEIVNALIEKGANVNAANTSGFTPLLQAAVCGHIEIVNILIEKGANVNAADEGGFTPLLQAVRCGHIEIAYTLIEKGADVNAVEEHSQYTLLHRAVETGNAEVVKALVEKGADFTRTAFGTTPLNLCGYRSLDIGEILIRHTLIKNPRMKKPNSLIEKLSEYWDRCLDEVKKMQKEKIDGNVTFYDILTSKDDNKLARYIRNKNIVEVLEESDYKSEFPMYAGEIENQYQKGIKRENLLNEGTVRIQNSDIGGKLPEEICRKVAKYLSNTDIQKLNDSASAFRRPSKGGNIT
ncbi:ankyrin repeat domain-containing protein [Wolbachia endosymbiont of Zygogramma bicolorata]|uniref:ankyrin repeat domain-containing protein n=1 Tax=Wolbachia endosymbiont of Zygogramma bicolorata TaxID=3134048 RepID=UPI003DA8F789